ncbi:MAG: cysteine hydrolase [Clostridiales bacterium]|nr:cysteine hydrolase [Clostridiales bacterium]
MKNVLIVIDMQNDFIDGSLGTKEAQAIVPKVIEKIKNAKENGETVIYTRDTHESDYLQTQEGRLLPVTHCIRGTDGWRIPEAIRPHCDADDVIDKPSFGYTGWKDVIDASCAAITLIGLCTDICVVSNALILKALFPEVPVAVDAACCAGVTPEKHLAALETMRSCQIQVINA